MFEFPSLILTHTQTQIFTLYSSTFCFHTFSLLVKFWCSTRTRNFHIKEHNIPSKANMNFNLKPGELPWKWSYKFYFIMFIIFLILRPKDTNEINHISTTMIVFDCLRNFMSLKSLTPSKSAPQKSNHD